MNILQCICIPCSSYLSITILLSIDYNSSVFLNSYKQSLSDNLDKFDTSPNIRFALFTFAFVIYLYLDRFLSLGKNVRETRRVTQKWTIQRNWQHRVHKTKKTNKAKNTTQKTKKMYNKNSTKTWRWHRRAYTT